jgi:hypothetical protein
LIVSKPLESNLAWRTSSVLGSAALLTAQETTAVINTVPSVEIRMVVFRRQRLVREGSSDDPGNGIHCRGIVTDCIRKVAVSLAPFPVRQLHGNGDAWSVVELRAGNNREKPS